MIVWVDLWSFEPIYRVVWADLCRGAKIYFSWTQFELGLIYLKIKVLQLRGPFVSVPVPRGLYV